MYNRYHEGWIEVIAGCMFAGKTEEFIRRINRVKYANKKILIFKPKIDNRYHETKIVSHFKSEHEAVVAETAQDIWNYLVKFEARVGFIDVIAIDEVQFFDDKVIDLAKKLANENRQVIVAGLDQDFRGEVFLITAKLLALAEFVTKLSAICVVCGSAGTKTQRIINGTAADYDDPIIFVGAKDSYEARCRRDHALTYKKQQFEVPQWTESQVEKS